MIETITELDALRARVDSLAQQFPLYPNLTEATL